MPPKKLKDLSSSPVYGMEHEQQVRLLSEALLREYMHRRGYLDTLKAFDEENPRSAETISSRALMSDLMALEGADQQRLKADGVETIMEMLCNLRVERRLRVDELVTAASADIPEVPRAELEKLQAKDAKRRAKKEKKKKKDKKNKGGDDIGDSKSSKKHKKKSSSEGTNKKNADGLTLDDLLGSGSSSDGEDASDAEDQKQQQQMGRQAPAPAWLGGANDDNNNSNNNESAALSSASDEDDESNDDEVNSDTVILGGQSTKAALQVLLGNNNPTRSPPPPFIQQGFMFDNAQPCHLMQWRRGPGAVIAAVQAHVMAYFYEKDLFMDDAKRRQDALQRSLTAMLLRAQPDPSKVVVVHGSLGRNKSSIKPEQTRQRMAMRFRMRTDFNSAGEISQHLGMLIEDEERHWSHPKGCGVWCFLVSLVLSRGADVIQSTDMQTRSSRALIDEEDNSGSIEMLNLCLCGRAVPRRHSATERDAVQAPPVRGYGSTLMCGILEGDVNPKLTSSNADAFRSATHPTFPCWVIHHKGHYSTLYMRKDTRRVFINKMELGGGASVDLWYWDPLSEDDEIPLTLKVSAAGAWGGSARNASSFVNQAILSIGEWASGVIDWKGETPVR